MPRLQFTHDGHDFSVDERRADAAGAASTSVAADSRLGWHVYMDGRLVLEFVGEYPYRDADLRKRVIEWYEIQKPGSDEPA